MVARVLWMLCAAMVLASLEAAPTSQAAEPALMPLAAGNSTGPRQVTHIFYINLAERVERRDWMEAQLASLPQRVVAERKEAIRVEGFSEALKVEALRPFLVDRPVLNCIKSGTQTNAGFAVSVFLSHISLYTSILKEHKFDGPNDLVLVVEDDVHIQPNFQERLNALLPLVPPEWEVLRIGHWGNTRQEDLVAPGVFAARQPFWVPPTTAFYGGAHAVLLDPQTLPSLLRKLSRVPLGDVDNMLTTCCTDLLSYVLEENLVELEQTLQDNSDNPHHDSQEQGVGQHDELMQLGNGDMNVQRAVGETADEKLLGILKESVAR